jgi:hypothetical protein
MKVKWLAVAALAAFLTGCPKIIPNQPAKMSNEQLCDAYGNAQSKSYLKGKLPEYRREIETRRLVPDEDWPSIESRQVKIGMSICGLRAAWGSSEERSLSTRYGESIQHIYRLSWCRRCKVQYVYTENGVVTAIQD